MSQISGDTDENEQTATFTVRLSSEPNSGDNSTSGDNVTIKMLILTHVSADVHIDINIKTNKDTHVNDLV